MSDRHEFGPLQWCLTAVAGFAGIVAFYVIFPKKRPPSPEERLKASFAAQNQQLAEQFMEQEREQERRRVGRAIAADIEKQKNAPSVIPAQAASQPPALKENTDDLVLRALQLAIGARETRVQSIPLFREAALRGSLEAQRVLGHIYIANDFAPVDRIEAAAWLKIASETNDKLALQMLAEVEPRLTADERYRRDQRVKQLSQEMASSQTH